jgi:aryl-alcohol dehydrogenase-like predicted oxidoreductase
MPQAALRFVLQHPGVSSVIAGAKSIEQVEDNAGAAGVPPIEGAELARALAVADTIRTPGWIG